MNSRLDNLLGIFGMQWCHVGFNETAEQIMDFNIDIQEVLQAERQKTLEYLTKAIIQN